MPDDHLAIVMSDLHGKRERQEHAAEGKPAAASLGGQRSPGEIEVGEIVLRDA